MSDSLNKGLAIGAMRMALQNRRAAPGPVCHPDRGVHYAGGDDRRPLSSHGARASRSGRGKCLDNAPMVHASRAPLRDVFGALKTEMVHSANVRSRREAKAALLEYIAIFHNRQPRYSRIGDRTPERARIDMTHAKAAKKGLPVRLQGESSPAGCRRTRIRASAG
ncbi:hypothetical protein LNKW23_11390 [Paralimibaculum aggregatum]|uniref:Integrase catalytic domain-containing protein n=1 Tax=Paralimibaculum aggregatum TaxID=3036245 RepID=A0ABQ6LHM0_9RHOB|nr:IS3 family transposase [Limibaculum sp. NKW23]GMG81926.1 hypothetical protein LNKW23_11390 [Limibaculum sp. NKW23]